MDFQRKMLLRSENLAGKRFNQRFPNFTSFSSEFSDTLSVPV
jgi:hypothetical protein